MLTNEEKNRLIFLYEKKKQIELRRPMTKHAQLKLTQTIEEIHNLEQQLTHKELQNE